VSTFHPHKNSLLPTLGQIILSQKETNHQPMTNMLGKTKLAIYVWLNTSAKEIGCAYSSQFPLARTNE